MSSTIQSAPIVSITESAATELKVLLSKEEEGKRFRVYVENGGCSGLQYGMVFDEERENDLSVEFFGVSVQIDPFSANYLQGAVIDFADSLNGGGFKVRNPNAKVSCGCGKSFEA